MKKYVKIILIYYSIILAIGVSSAIISHGWFSIVAICITALALLAAIIHIGIIIPNMEVKKRYFIYSGTIFATVIMSD